MVIWTITQSDVQHDNADGHQSDALQVTSLPAVLTLDESITSVDVHGNLKQPYLASLGLEDGRLLLYSFTLTSDWSLLCTFDRLS